MLSFVLSHPQISQGNFSINQILDRQCLIVQLLFQGDLEPLSRLDTHLKMCIQPRSGNLIAWLRNRDLQCTLNNSWEWFPVVCDLSEI